MRKIFNSIVTLSLIMILGTTVSCKKNNEPKVEEEIVNTIQVQDIKTEVKYVAVFLDIYEEAADIYEGGFDGINMILCSGDSLTDPNGVAIGIDLNTKYIDGVKHDFKDMTPQLYWSDWFGYVKNGVMTDNTHCFDNNESTDSGYVRCSINRENNTIDIEFKAILEGDKEYSVIYKGAYEPQEDYIYYWYE